MQEARIKILQDRIAQWSNMQNELLNRYMLGEFSKEEFKSTNNNLNKDIDGFRIEIHELTK